MIVIRDTEFLKDGIHINCGIFLLFYFIYLYVTFLSTTIDKFYNPPQSLYQYIFGNVISSIHALLLSFFIFYFFASVHHFFN